MTTFQSESKLANSYLGRIKKFSPEVKLDLATKILLSLKDVENKEEKPETSPEEYYAGAWDSDETPEEFAESLRSARYFDRKPIEL